LNVSSIFLLDNLNATVDKTFSEVIYTTHSSAWICSIQPLYKGRSLNKIFSSSSTILEDMVATISKKTKSIHAEKKRSTTKLTRLNQEGG
jgi:hypothetical protein